MAHRPRSARQMASILKAQKASVAAMKARGGHTHKPIKVTAAEAQRIRGTGISGLKKNASPYVRINKRSVTVGGGTGAYIPHSGSANPKRISFFGGARIEYAKRVTPVDRALDKALSHAAPWGTRRGKVMKWANKNVHVTNPATRVTVGKYQGRLGTSQKSGVSLILSKPKRTKQSKSRKGIQTYDNRMRTIARRKEHLSKSPRPQRRGKGVL